MLFFIENVAICGKKVMTVTVCTLVCSTVLTMNIFYWMDIVVLQKMLKVSRCPADYDGLCKLRQSSSVFLCNMNIYKGPDSDPSCFFIINVLFIFELFHCAFDLHKYGMCACMETIQGICKLLLSSYW